MYLHGEIMPSGDIMDNYKNAGISTSNREDYIVEHVAKQYGLSKSAAARLIINDYGNRNNIHPPIPEVEDDGYHPGHA